MDCYDYEGHLVKSLPIVEGEPFVLSPNLFDAKQLYFLMKVRLTH
jgi:hypothetical protein